MLGSTSSRQPSPYSAAQRELRSKAFELVQEREYAKAAGILLPLAQHRPDDVTALLNLGVALICSDRKRDGLAVLDMANTLAPDDSRTSRLLGLAQFHQGFHDLAFPHLLVAALAKPLDFVLHFRLGLAAMNIGQHQAAVQSLRRAVRLRPKALNAHKALLRAGYRLIRRKQDSAPSLMNEPALCL